MGTTLLGLDAVSFVAPPQRSPTMLASARLAHVADPCAIWYRFIHYRPLRQPAKKTLQGRVKRGLILQVRHVSDAFQPDQF